MSRVMDLLSTAPDDLPPRYGSDRSATAIGRVIRLDDGGRSVVVSLFGGPPVQVPATAVNWAGVETAHVLIDQDTGRPIHALGPAPKPETPLLEWVPPTSPPQSAREAVIPAQWVGTWDGTAWTRYGGGGAWQGKSPAGRALRGLALFGRQIEALGRIDIRSAVLTLRPAPSAVPWSVQVGAATYSDAGPGTVGPTVSAPVQVGADLIEVDVMRLAESMKAPGMGIALVGAAYGGVKQGGDSLSLRLEYMQEENA